MADFAERLLFGGAIKCKVPPNFADISVIRTVPDHQEVFVDNDSNTSLIVEILERQEDLDDADAARFVFNDLCDLNQASSNIVDYESVYKSSECMPGLIGEFSLCGLIGRQEVTKNNKVENLLIFMALVRLESVNTDLLITLNIVDQNNSNLTEIVPLIATVIPASLFLTPLFQPQVNDQQISPAIGNGITVFHLALQTFVIENWALFV